MISGPSSIISRITLLAVVLMLAGSGAVAYLVFDSFSHLLTQEEFDDLGDYSRLERVALLSGLRELRENTLLLAGLPPVAGIVRATSAHSGAGLNNAAEARWTEQLATSFLWALDTHPEYLGLSFIGVADEGRELVRLTRVAGGPARTHVATKLRRVGQESYFQEALQLPAGRVRLSQLELKRKNDPLHQSLTPVLTASTPVYDGTRIFGVLTVTLDFDAVVRSLNAFSAGNPDIGTYITNSSGDFLVYSNGPPAFGLEPGKRYQAQDEFPALAKAFEPGSPAETEFITGPLGEEGAVVHFTKVPLDSPPSDRFLGLLQVARHQDVISGTLSARKRAFVLAGSMAVLGALLAAFVTRRELLPLRQLTRAVAGLGSGEAVPKLPRRAGQEIQLLSDTLARMERQVRERTEALQLKAGELEQANTELQQFAYVVSHDLRAPLRAVSGLAAWMAEDLQGRMEGETLEQMHLLQDRVTRMDTFISAMLAYAQAGRPVDSPRKVEVGALLNEVVDSLAPPSSFVVEIADRMPTVEADRLQLSQVFSNLIGNAVKYVDRPDGRIRITCRESGDFYEFAVADNGPGIAPEHQEQIFNLYQTLKSRDVSKSTGMGLAIVKKIVERAGGRIRVESGVGQGSTFLFTWPKHPSAPSVADLA